MVGEKIQNQNTCLPADCKKNVPFGVAFDNFDELCETLLGSNTLHDTMGIMYQAESISSECMNVPASTIGKGSNSRKRKLDVTVFNLQPYRKKPRMTIFEYQCRDVWKSMDTKRRKGHLDFTWMVCYGLITTNIPMWVGFNSQFYVDELQKQRRAIRTNDVELYSFALTPIIDLFFATNHVNYARWLTKFQLDLLNIDNTHPGLSDLLNSGLFTVRRTDHSFSRIPVDLTLEQSINANAASRQTGLSHMTNNFGARQRWMVTRPLRALMVSSILQMAGMSNPENASNELKPTRIMRDHEDYSKIVKQIKNSCDPFILPEDTDDSLINISTG
ncbi:hypothetical protein LOTGIDRAFT_164356 [Lottia gigantea]|uniref:Uncharacterized protein n=1 Tax=Lottia gigantea TaxID=225164 RepID=V3ZFT8_LOTGI|nr:hypothetical protein LOTGIDRAFT_164356 [Lottia gigantea]ESO90053.1 hypothetical protein LOTGIDRAFT_164356 [Lottia gigantea]